MVNVMKDWLREKDRVLKFTKLGDYLCDKAYHAVANILVFGFETLEEVFQQAASKTRRSGLVIIIIDNFLMFYR
jgi:hypothetical protein